MRGVMVIPRQNQHLHSPLVIHKKALWPTFERGPVQTPDPQLPQRPFQRLATMASWKTPRKIRAQWTPLANQATKRRIANSGSAVEFIPRQVSRLITETLLVMVWGFAYHFLNEPSIDLDYASQMANLALGRSGSVDFRNVASSCSPGPVQSIFKTLRTTTRIGLRRKPWFEFTFSASLEFGPPELCFLPANIYLS